jgi:hypothetical protein
MREGIQAEGSIEANFSPMKGPRGLSEIRRRKRCQAVGCQRELKAWDTQK